MTQQTKKPTQLKGNDGAQYVRMQKGHSITAWVLICILTGPIGLTFVLVYSLSKNHYWHA